jgi:glycosyltransferase involved in cell wall biosynthesis
MKKVLHITNWYPHKWNDLEAIFIKQQFDLFSKVSDTSLLHIQVRESESWFRYDRVIYSKKETGYYIFTKIKIFRLIEIMTTMLLMWALLRSKVWKYDILHFHIAYPLLTYFHIWKYIIKKPVIISEHWSAYHFNFYLPWSTKKLDRIKNIFYQGLPLVTVSKALLNDIQIFAGTKAFPSYVIPNSIDLDVYKYHSKKQENDKPVFFMVNFWRSIKNPFPILESFLKLKNEGIDFELRIGGYGPILEEMKLFVRDSGLNKEIIFLGKMYKKEIAKEMNHADAYLYASEYETFSMVCAEALCCGCPLIGPSIPSILEYTEDGNLELVEPNETKGWENAIKRFLKRKGNINKVTVAQGAEKFFAHNKILEQYKVVIDE